MWNIAALYRFVTLNDLPALQKALENMCQMHDICGTLLLAPEGINGTIAAPSQNAMDAIIDWLDQHCAITKGELKFSYAQERPFRKMRVRLKKEIITMQAPEADPSQRVGTYVTPQDWDALTAQNDVTLIDTRNDYETALGIFKGALDPNIKTFTEFKDWVAENLNPHIHKKVAMFCTGGIRCEKASSYMLAHGFEEVYHLKGGILKYLEEIPAEKSTWKGDCFVFDRRIAVGHGLQESSYQTCYGCRLPLSPDDLQSSSYEEGVSCPHCAHKLTPERASALRMRHTQLQTKHT